MTNRTISALTAATTPLAGTETLPVFQGATTVKITRDQLFTPAAAKGINFTANTPAAGMTSQLLNWYEEGTWTPSRTGFTEVLGAGSITATGRYIRIGKSVTIQITLACAGGATIAATAGIGSYFGGLPFTPAVLSSGTWVDGSSIAADGGFLVHTNTNLYMTTGWTAAPNVWYFSATYFV